MALYKDVILNTPCGMMINCDYHLKGIWFEKGISTVVDLLDPLRIILEMNYAILTISR